MEGTSQREAVDLFSPFRKETTVARPEVPVKKSAHAESVDRTPVKRSDRFASRQSGAHGSWPEHSSETPVVPPNFALETTSVSGWSRRRSNRPTAPIQLCKRDPGSFVLQFGGAGKQHRSILLDDFNNLKGSPHEKKMAEVACCLDCAKLDPLEASEDVLDLEAEHDGAPVRASVRVFTLEEAVDQPLHLVL